MNRSKIEWCDHTFNPITGCLHNCEYCYARRMSTRFAGDIRLNMLATRDYHLEPAKGSIYVLEKPMINETGKQLIYPFGFNPTLHLYRIRNLEKLKSGKNIFVGAMADIFGEWVPDNWLDKVMAACKDNEQHNYLFLTKNPARYTSYSIPVQENMWYGTTITGNGDIDKLAYMEFPGNKFISVEPFHKRISPEHIKKMCDVCNWIIVGAETGNRNSKIIPKKEWVEDILFEADKCGIPVFMKDSLIPIVGNKNMRIDFPERLKNTTPQISLKQRKRLFGNCTICNEPKKKSDMITLLARSKRGECPRQYAFMCTACFEQFCKKYNVDLPDLECFKKEGAE